MTPWLWESPIYKNTFMNLVILPELLSQFGLKMVWLGQKQTKQAYKIAKFMQIFVWIGESQSQGVMFWI